MGIVVAPTPRQRCDGHQAGGAAWSGMPMAIGPAAGPGATAMVSVG